MAGTTPNPVVVGSLPGAGDCRCGPVCPSAIRRIVLEQSKRANVGHIGSCLSIADIVAAIFGGVLRATRPDDPDRDRFVLSKGHAALALYAALHLRGRLSAEELDTFCGDGSRLGVHPEHGLPGVDFSTGSLGQGLAVGAGAVLAARVQGSDRRVFVLLSDAECNEGSVWEAAMFAAHNRLENLVAIIDSNGQQALGYTRDVLDLGPLGHRWAAFGWDTHVVDGNDVADLAAKLGALVTPVGPGDPGVGRPHVIVAETVFGKGVSFMERQVPWHYKSMSDAEYEQAMSDVEEAACAAHSSER